MYNKKRGKRGLSPVVATVLLIALVLVLAMIVFLWARGFISEQVEKFGQPVETVCEDVRFDVEYEVGDKSFLNIVNRGNIEIHNLDIKAIKRGNSEVKTFNFPIEVGGSRREEITFNTFDLHSFDDPIEKIEVFPRILGNVKGKQINRAFTCVEHSKVINL
jgi:flagellin-like protein